MTAYLASLCILNLLKKFQSRRRTWIRHTIAVSWHLRLCNEMFWQSTERV